MSLRDTIEGARREAQENASGMPKREKKDKKAEAAREADGERQGFVRPSAAKAKPAREAASSVRVASKPTSKGVLGKPETKEEKRERRRKEREQEDLRNRAYDLILRSIPGYKKTERIFWITLGAGMALAVVSLVSAGVFGENPDLTTWQGMLSVGSLVLAYACIIGGFIFNLVKCRPFRREAEARVRGLTDKKMAELFERDQLERVARQAEKDARKGAKK